MMGPGICHYGGILSQRGLSSLLSCVYSTGNAVDLTAYLFVLCLHSSSSCLSFERSEAATNERYWTVLSGRSGRESNRRFIDNFDIASFLISCAFGRVLNGDEQRAPFVEEVVKHFA
jgi:hypothetical protein